MDTDDCPLMGAHGYCSQEMVHLLQGTIHILRKQIKGGWGRSVFAYFQY